MNASLNGAVQFHPLKIRDQIHDFQLLNANPAASQILQRPLGDARGQVLSAIIPASDRTALLRRCIQTMNTGQPTRLDTAIPARGGTIYLRLKAAALGDTLLLTMVDITDEMQALKALSRLQVILDRASDMISTHHADGRFEQVTPSCQRILGYACHELIGVPLQTLLHPDDRDVLSRHEGRGGDAIRCRMRRRDGDWIWLEMAFNAAWTEDGEKLIVVSRDVSRQHALEQELLALIQQDPLTGLLNRRAAFEALHSFPYTPDRPLTMAILDLDHFKRINDTYGHPAGDQALKVFAELLRDNLRGSDLMARIGGEEFMILLPGANPEAARMVVDRIREKLSALRIHTGTSVFQITVSVGQATMLPQDTPDSLYQRADRALYEAKAKGRNRVELAQRCA
ncbi:MAG: diguanylate cyclase [Myxococcota bacterium]